MNSLPGQASIVSGVPSLCFDFDNKNCPTCGQAIPPDKLEEIAGRIAAREREHIRAIQKAKADVETQVNLIIGTSSRDAAA